MNPLLLMLADGTSFFIGLGVTLVASLLILRYRMGSIRVFLTLIAFIGIAFVGLSATPLPIDLYLAWLLPITIALASGYTDRITQDLRRKMAIVILIATALFGFAEWRYHRLPYLYVESGTTVYVVGDSISAGIGGEQKCWPSVFTEMTSLPVINLAKAGATVQTALKQIDAINETNATVILEIGGNDVIGGTDPAMFRDQLDHLVSALRMRHHQVLMLELPLFPFQNAYGAAQRSIAAKYHTLLLPKRFFTAILGMKNGTSDGLHLSQQGHEAMARMIAGVVRKE